MTEEKKAEAEGGVLSSFISLLVVIGIVYFMNWLLCSDPISYKCSVCDGTGSGKAFGMHMECNGCGGDGKVEEGDKLWKTKGKLH